jgi:hypothetical protein
LDEGFALGGRDAAAMIDWDDGLKAFEGPFGVQATSLTRALADTQRALVSYLRDKGFTPRFD